MNAEKRTARIVVIFVFGALFMLDTVTAWAAVPGLINLQGRLTDASNNPLPDASYSVTFRIYDADAGGTVLWSEVSQVTTAEGVFSANLGAVTPVPDSVFNNPNRWLGIQMQGDAEMTPRTRLTSGAYAYATAQWNSVGQDLFRSSGDVGIGTTDPISKLHIVSDVSGLPPRLQSSGTTSFAAGWDFYHGASGKGYVGVPDSDQGIAPGEMLLYGSPGTQTSMWAGGVRGVTVGTNGNVGIGTVPNSVDKLSVETSEPVAIAVTGLSNGIIGTGLKGQANSGSIAYGVWGLSSSGYAGYFNGNVHVEGTLTKNAGSFKIDHPLDPANKYLSHSFVESPDMMNIYNGNVTLDSKGEAVIALPDWFGALNRDFRYQLTAIGAPGPNLYVAQKVVDNQFRIAGGAAGMEVSWQVTGIRQDAYANAHRIPVEESKPDMERGFYMHPELFSQPEEKGIEWARRPEMMKQMKGAREKAKAEAGD